MSRTSIKVFAPATVANVACGFDILGFALHEPGDEVIARSSDEPGIRITKIFGDKGKLPLDVNKNTAGIAASAFLQEIDYDGGIELEIHKKMPFGSGLGSSAASAVAGVFAVNELLERPKEKRELLHYAVLGEQGADGSYHADNVAPCLLGGMILIRDNKTLDVHRIPCPSGLYAIVIYPQINILTRSAREVLSEQVSLKQHIQQSGNIAALVLSLHTGDFDLLGRALNDVIIEPQRAPLIPHFYTVKDAALKAGALGCSISGSGPSIFALSNNSLIAEQVGQAMEAAFSDAKVESTVFISEINNEGVIKC